MKEKFTSDSVLCAYNEFMLYFKDQSHYSQIYTLFVKIHHFLIFSLNYSLSQPFPIKFPTLHINVYINTWNIALFSSDILKSSSDKPLSFLVYNIYNLNCHVRRYAGNLQSRVTISNDADYSDGGERDLHGGNGDDEDGNDGEKVTDTAYGDDRDYLDGYGDGGNGSNVDGDVGNGYRNGVDGADRDGVDKNGEDGDGADKNGKNGDGDGGDGTNKNGDYDDGADKNGDDENREKGDGADNNGEDRDGADRDRGVKDGADTNEENGDDNSIEDGDGADKNEENGDGNGEDGADGDGDYDDGADKNGENGDGNGEDGDDTNGDDGNGANKNEENEDGNGGDGADGDGDYDNGGDKNGENGDGADRDGEDGHGADKNGENGDGDGGDEADKNGDDEDGDDKNGDDEDGADNNGEDGDGADKNGEDGVGDRDGTNGVGDGINDEGIKTSDDVSSRQNASQEFRQELQDLLHWPHEPHPLALTWYPESILHPDELRHPFLESDFTSVIRTLMQNHHFQIVLDTCINDEGDDIRELELGPIQCSDNVVEGEGHDQMPGQLFYQQKVTAILQLTIRSPATLVSHIESEDEEGNSDDDDEPILLNSPPAPIPDTHTGVMETDIHGATGYSTSAYQYDGLCQFCSIFPKYKILCPCSHQLCARCSWQFQTGNIPSLLFCPVCGTPVFEIKITRLINVFR